MRPEFLWHIAGMSWSPRRCKHRVISEAGPFFIVQATCKRIPDPSEDWKNAEFKVRQILRTYVIPGEIPKDSVSSGQWFSSCPPLPEKREPRPYIPPPPPWATCSEEEFRRTWSPRLKDALRDLFGEGQIPEAAEVLGVSWPCTQEEARAAYRRKAREVHPDAGGSSEAFVRLKAAYDRVTKALKGRQAA
ncbi:MAG: Chaperone protein DnaJ [Candidatus Aminicenantes bacterium ADurb.Bin508]|nr:MAG: Chaperone protein DnaJ [Candidatus Aminicenantes bacterium ADurb.Bin508]